MAGLFEGFASDNPVYIDGAEKYAKRAEEAKKHALASADKASASEKVITEGVEVVKDLTEQILGVLEDFEGITSINGVHGSGGNIDLSADDVDALPVTFTDNLSQGVYEKKHLRDFGVKGDGVADDTEAVIRFSQEDLTTAVCNMGNTNIEDIDSRNFKDTVLTTVNGRINHFPQGFLGETAHRISNGELYTAWAQDSSYVLGTQLRVWISQKHTHTDANGTPVCLYSDDNGATYGVAVLDEKLDHHSVWSAGVAHGKEYVILREEVDYIADCTHLLYYRDVPTGKNADHFFGGWEVKEIPAAAVASPYGDGKAAMLHSFTEDADGFAVGAHNGKGSWVIKTTNMFETFKITTIQKHAVAEEPTLRYHNGIYYGFQRAGGNENPKFWKSEDNLQTITYYSCPRGYFGPGFVAKCPVGFDIDKDGNIHAFVAFRNGSDEGRPEDKEASMYYLTCNVEGIGNFWTKAKVYHLGVVFHAETGGASALGVGAVTVHNNNVYIYGGNEGRFGSDKTRDRVVDIYQWVIPLKKSWGAYDFRERIASNGVASTQFHKMKGESRMGTRMRTHMIHDERISNAYKNSEFLKDARGYIIDNASGGVDKVGYHITTDVGWGGFYVHSTVDDKPRGLRVHSTSTGARVQIVDKGEAALSLWDATKNATFSEVVGGSDLGTLEKPWKDLHVNTIKATGASEMGGTLTINRSLTVKSNGNTNPIITVHDVNNTKTGSLEWSRNSDHVRLSKFSTEDGTMLNAMSLKNDTTVFEKPLYEKDARVITENNSSVVVEQAFGHLQTFAPEGGLRGSTFIRLESGTFLHFSGQSGTWFLRRSTDEFKTYTVNTRAITSGRDASFVQNKKTGRVFFVASRGKKFADSRPGLTEDETGQIFYQYSDDDGVTWSGRTYITEQVKDPLWKYMLTSAGTGVCMEDGTIVVPCGYVEYATPGVVGTDQIWKCCVITSKDNGVTWECGGPIAVGANEPSIARSGRNLYTLARNTGYYFNTGDYPTLDYLYYKVSTNGGKSWKESKGNMQIEQVTQSMNTIGVVTHRNKDYFLCVKAFSKDGEHGRGDGKVLLSDDSGTSWREVLQLDKYLAYSSIADMGDGRVMICYEADDYESVKTQILSIPELLSTVSPGKIRQYTVIESNSIPVLPSTASVVITNTNDVDNVITHIRGGSYGQILSVVLRNSTSTGSTSVVVSNVIGSDDQGLIYTPNLSGGKTYTLNSDNPTMLFKKSYWGWEYIGGISKSEPSSGGGSGGGNTGGTGGVDKAYVDELFESTLRNDVGSQRITAPTVWMDTNSTGTGDGGFKFSRDGSRRWQFWMNSAAENGGNAGSNLLFRGFNDDGTTHSGNIFDVTRATRVLNFGVTPTVAGQAVYHAGNKPTAADVGAVSDSGGKIEGSLEVSGNLDMGSFTLSRTTNKLQFLV